VEEQEGNMCTDQREPTTSRSELHRWAWQSHQANHCSATTRA